HQGKTSRTVEAPLRSLDQGGRRAVDPGKVRRGAVPLAGGALSEKMGVHAPKADKESFRAEARKRQKMAGRGISRHRKTGQGRKGYYLFRGRDRLQERPPGREELCPQW